MHDIYDMEMEYAQQVKVTYISVGGTRTHEHNNCQSVMVANG